MKFSVKKLGVLILSIILIIAALIFFNVIPLESLPLRGAGKLRQTIQKISRPREIQNATYTESLAEGDGAFFKKDFESARAAYQKASEAEPREALPYEKIGNIYFAQKNYQDARSNFEFAASLAPASATLKLKVARSMLGLRKVIDAQLFLEKIQPETQESVYYRGLISAFLNQQAQAKDLLTKSEMLGENMGLKGNAQKILDLYRDFELAREAPVEFLQAKLAEAFDQLGEYGLAIELAFDALKTEHNYRDVWIVLGHSYLNEEKWLDSEDAFSKAIELDTTHPAAFFFRGIARRRLGKINEALTDFNQALATNFQPKILAKFELAEIYFELKDFDKAYPLYKEVVSTDPNDINRFVRPIALAINHLKKPAEAADLARTAYTAHKDTAMAHNLLGWAALASGDFTAAHQHLEEALRRDQKFAAVYLNLGQLAEKEGKIDQALSYYEKAMQYAEQTAQPSIFETAHVRYTILKEGGSAQETGQAILQEAEPIVPQNAPQSEKIIPSLSLE